jgi:hypothetical protein
MCFAFCMRPSALLLAQTLSHDAGFRDQAVHGGAEVTERLGLGLRASDACTPISL